MTNCTQGEIDAMFPWVKELFRCHTLTLSHGLSFSTTFNQAPSKDGRTRTIHVWDNDLVKRVALACGIELGYSEDQVVSLTASGKPLPAIKYATFTYDFIKFMLDNKMSMSDAEAMVNLLRK